MPVIVIGADTPLGMDIARGLADTDQEVRAFVSDPEVVPGLRAMGFKVATGDVSDFSHIEGACTNVITAVLVTGAADDHRERSFAADRSAVLAGWAEAVEEAQVTRVIWVDDGDPPLTEIAEEAVVDAALAPAEVVRRVVSLDEAGSISSRR